MDGASTFVTNDGPYEISVVEAFAKFHLLPQGGRQGTRNIDLVALVRQTWFGNLKRKSSGAATRVDYSFPLLLTESPSTGVPLHRHRHVKATVHPSGAVTVLYAQYLEDVDNLCRALHAYLAPYVLSNQGAAPVAGSEPRNVKLTHFGAIITPASFKLPGQRRRNRINVRRLCDLCEAAPVMFDSQDNNVPSARQRGATAGSLTAAVEGRDAVDDELDADDLGSLFGDAESSMSTSSRSSTTSSGSSEITEEGRRAVRSSRKVTPEPVVNSQVSGGGVPATQNSSAQSRGAYNVEVLPSARRSILRVRVSPHSESSRRRPVEFLVAQTGTVRVIRGEGLEDVIDAFSAALSPLLAKARNAG